MVVDRIATSMIPKRAPGNYLRSHIGLNPDLYGPFWIIMTLVSLFYICVYSIMLKGFIRKNSHNFEVS